MMRLFLSMSHLSWPVQGCLVCAAFLLVGMVVVGDYAVGFDTRDTRTLADRTRAFITGDAPHLHWTVGKASRHYGMAFELPLLLIERGMEGTDPRNIYLMRHLITHLFFLAGGLCCSLLVYRMCNSRGLALLALLLFLLQPRLYAHSFFNSRDSPFLSMFMVTLYLTHQAFRKDTVGAFLLCGVSVGILTNLRIMGLMLYPAVLALRGLDLVQTNWGEWKHVVVTGAVFALAGPGTLYALSPYLWTNPFEFVTAVQTLAHHINRPADELFQGSLIDPHQLPWHYIPTWIAISTPPITLLGGVLGVLGVGLRSVLRPRAALGNTELRFGLLLVACLTLPVVAIIALGSHIYNGWRQVYFLHAPLCGLAGLGLQWAGGASRQARVWVYALTGVGVLVTGGGWQLHPHQQVYFNGLVDRMTPEALRTHYVLDPWGQSCREGLDFLRRRYPATTVYVQNSWPVYNGWLTLPQAGRARLVLVEEDADVRISCGKELQANPRVRLLSVSAPFDTSGPIIKELQIEDALYVRKVYNSTLLTVTGLVTVPEKERVGAYRTDSYRGVISGRLVQQAEFDLYSYRHSRRLGFARDGCTASAVQAPFFLHIVPTDSGDLPPGRRRYGFDNLDFAFNVQGSREKGRCYTSVALPAYAIAHIRTGQYTERGPIWKTELSGRFFDSGVGSPERENENDGRRKSATGIPRRCSRCVP